jgi:chromosome segregation ATPase
MTSAARKFIVEERTIRLEERVGFIQADIAEIKTDYRRLDAKVDATRDSVSDVKDSVAALRVETMAGFRAVDRQTSAIEVTLGLLNGSLAALHTKVEDLSSAVRETREDLRNETRALSVKIDETRTSLLDSCNALFDRKFFRAMGVFGSALPLLAAAFTYAQRTALGMAEIAVIAAGMSVIIFFGTYLATRTHR